MKDASGLFLHSAYLVHLYMNLHTCLFCIVILNMFKCFLMSVVSSEGRVCFFLLQRAESTGNIEFISCFLKATLIFLHLLPIFGYFGWPFAVFCRPFEFS